MKYTTLLLCALSITFTQCKVNKNPTAKNNIAERNLSEVIVTDNKNKATAFPYQPTATIKSDLLHTTLWLNFDYTQQHVLGKAKLVFKPYCYPQHTLEIDAQKFIIHQVALLGTDTLPLVFTYDEKRIYITLNKTYTANDTFSIFIDYTAQPNEIKEEGSSAISEAKGLYFINPIKEDADKPRQIWSQGETQSNSGWFPTMDIPNEKMTQEIYLTVDSSDITLSNGELIYSKEHLNGTRTDYWAQQYPHAPYLTMIAVGEFVETKDTWRDSIAVNSYLEKAYAPYAKMIFGTTPEMMECFSKRLGVDYPWEKFSQIVVRDFVSGAMENTSAVVHFELVQHTAREHLDNKWEDIIAHELFHHWFGDLVTSESWSNLSLNESFATYGEYLWNEYKYGKLYADYDFDDNLQAYLRQKSAHKKELIRFHYKNREDMFDVVSYQKGSRIIHMLRNYVGDKAFFASLKLYLTQQRFKAAEIHQLRLAFEEITGEDLNWFFNQWYLNSGHPILDVIYTYNNTETAVNIRIKQTQDTTQTGVYKLPIAIDVYSNGKATRHKVWVDKADWQVTLNSNSKIDLTNVDGDKILLAKITENKTETEYYYQFEHAPHFLDKEQAVNAIVAAKIDSVTPALVGMIYKALLDSFFGVKELGMQLISALPKNEQLQFEPSLKLLAKLDTKASIRVDAIELLSTFNGNQNISLFIEGTNDSAYSVVIASLHAIAEINSDTAMYIVDFLTAEKNIKLRVSLSSLIAEYAKTDYIRFYETLILESGIYNSFVFTHYTDYLEKQDTSIQLKAMPQLRSWYTAANGRYKKQTKSLIERLQKIYIVKNDEATEELKNKKLPAITRSNLIHKQQTSKSMYDKLGAILNE
jgi:aminopeptidase N